MQNVTVCYRCLRRMGCEIAGKFKPCWICSLEPCIYKGVKPEKITLSVCNSCHVVETD